MYTFSPGSTSKSVFFLLRDSASGQPKPGLTAASPGAVAVYTRQGGTATAIALSDLASATAAFSAGGLFMVDTGVYRFDVPDAALAAGCADVAVRLGFDNALGDAVLIYLLAPGTVAGAGATPFTVTVIDGATALPLQGVSVWVTTDPAGSNVSAGSLTTNALGQVLFALDAGPSYIFVRRGGYTATNPTPVTVTTSPSGTTVVMTPTVAPVGLATSTPHEPRVTYADLVDRLLDYLGTDAGENAARYARRAAVDGYRELTTAHKWTCLQGWGDVILNGLYTAGTVSYLHTGGTWERQLTLAGGVWPAWAASGYVRIGTVNYPVLRRQSDTVLTLDALVNPGADVAALTAYSLARDTYTLPADFVATDNPQAENNWGGLEYVRNQEWFATVSNLESYGQPHFYTLTGDPDVPGRLCFRVFPVPSTDQHLRFLYQRKPRKLLLLDYSAGAATVDALGSPTTVTFQGATLTAAHEGCVLRLSPDSTNAPTGPEGLNPAVLERTVLLVNSPSSVTVDQSADQSLAGVRFSLSDPVDFEDLQLNALYRCCEKQEAIARLMDNAGTANNAYLQALVLAKEADSRVMARRRATVGGGHFRQRLRDMPRGPDVS